MIEGCSKRGDILIDQSVGKAGDLPKWIGSKLSFVFGLDIARDNIENRIDGACARYLNYKKRYNMMPDALFVRANSGLNIRSGDACFTDKGRLITRAVFGEGSKDETILGGGVYKQFAKGKDGFDIVSNQFSIHYFFENKLKLNNFLRNVSECCKLGGYFIGTSYDGKKLFQNLESKEVGESVKIIEQERKLWEITKRYDNVRLMDDETCLGYTIDVYQETINKTFSEYLVNYDYLVRILENYGFVPISKDEAREMNMPNSIGNFSEMFSKMEDDIRSGFIRRGNIKDALKMKAYEKKISFLNNYFIFKKVRDVNAREIAAALIGSQREADEPELPEIDEGKQALKKIERPKARKIKKKMKLFTISKPEEESSDKQEESKQKNPKKIKMKLTLKKEDSAGESKKSDEDKPKKRKRGRPRKIKLSEK